MNKSSKDILHTAVALHVTFKVNMESAAQQSTPLKNKSSEVSATT